MLYTRQDVSIHSHLSSCVSLSPHPPYSQQCRGTLRVVRPWLLNLCLCETHKGKAATAHVWDECENVFLETANQSHLNFTLMHQGPECAGFNCIKTEKRLFGFFFYLSFRWSSTRCADAWRRNTKAATTMTGELCWAWMMWNAMLVRCC